MTDAGILGAEAGRGGPFDRRLATELVSVRHLLAASVAMGLVATGSLVVQAISLAALLASALPGAHHVNDARLLVIFGAAVIVRALAALSGELIASRATSTAKADLRSKLLETALAGAASTGNTAGGDLATLAGRGLDALDIYLGRCIPDLVLAVVAPLGLLAVVGALDLMSGVIIFALLVLFPVFGALVGRTSTELAGDRWRQVEALGRKVSDIFTGLPLLKAFGCAPEQRAKIEEAGDSLRRASLGTLRIAFLSALVLDTLASISVALVAVPLGLRLLGGHIPLSTALAVLIIAPEVFLPLRRASSEFHESTEGLAAASAAFDEIDGGTTMPSVLDTTHRYRSTPDPSTVSVGFDEVSVAFPGRLQPVLASASLSIAPGETVVLLGANGAGKSTALMLLLGFVAPGSGRITIGAADLSALDPSSWRRTITYLPEHPTLLSTSLRENLLLARPAASDEACIEALNSAGASNFLSSLTEGLATRIGEGGRSVSAGERQRIALARVHLRQTSLYLLDEPTVHLDDAAEILVVESLASTLSGKSALIATHRPALLEIADRVVVLRGGNFVEEPRRNRRDDRSFDADATDFASGDASIRSFVVRGPTGLGTR